eukprot:2586591-Alexandrium_andersonii.AAC.1
MLMPFLDPRSSSFECLRELRISRIGELQRASRSFAELRGAPGKPRGSKGTIKPLICDHTVTTP